MTLQSPLKEFESDDGTTAALAADMSAEQILAVSLLLNPRRWRWTRAHFERAAELGVFGPKEKVELIHGEVVEKMTQNSPHVTGVNLVHEALRRSFPRDYSIRTQQPLNIGTASQPEPDVCVVAGTVRDYETEHPKTALLVVEVADSSLAFDRMKAGLYAQAGALEYWILILADRALEVYRDPAPMADQPYGFSYRTVLRLTETQSISPVAAPEESIVIADLLPRPRPAGSD